MSSHDSPHPEKASNGTGAERRPSERRKRNIPVALDRRGQAGGRKDDSELRVRAERRRMVDPTTCEREYDDDEIAFMKAMDQYKRDNRRPFPTWSEVLEVLRALGYRKVAEPTALPGLQRDPADVPLKG
jgi:hypothetical protein